MNCEVCELKEVEVEHYEIREVLRCILHTILFHRALGLVRPKDVDCELFEITYVQCGDPEIEKKIEDKIDEFINKVDKHPNRRSQICLSFYDTKNKQPSWFISKVERLYWETWCINLHVLNPKSLPKSHQNKVIDAGACAFEETESHRAALESSLREVLFQIIKFANEKKDHLPPIPSNKEGASFPYEITIVSSSESSFGWHADVFKRMLQTGHPTMIG
ncbi:autophagy-related protein 101-like [Ananas comosus]|uniref:Autophagy-related protein 101 n=2 Tax=Ananas comosus TaxID=4615 RepID=A0A199W5P0_ANACO|nr:autophagy-related protein 101-like [Ananas comosus]XP_020095866.1 autophagy-related protein 101-like [Ananas comosus]OAY84629.1 Autophagy-related protein 101 [Ananas comosus]CAD1819502.1 unnamed protein product [Ananas comosus var. bracteatus]